jgi:hypothetical protein
MAIYDQQWYGVNGCIRETISVEDKFGICHLIEEFNKNGFVGCKVVNPDINDVWIGHIMRGIDLLEMDNLRKLIVDDPDVVAKSIGVVVYRIDGTPHSVYCNSTIEYSISMMFEKIVQIMKSYYEPDIYKKFAKEEFLRKSAYKAWFLDGNRVTSKYFLTHTPGCKDHSMSLHVGYEVNNFYNMQNNNTAHLIVRFYSKEQAIKEYEMLAIPNMIDAKSVIPPSCLHHNFSAVFDFQSLPSKEGYTVVHHTTLEDLIELVDEWVDGLFEWSKPSKVANVF